MKPSIQSRGLLFIAALLLVLPVPAFAESSESPRDDFDVRHPVLHKVVFYLPNRVFDLVDIVRLRARVGPGVSAGVRVTDFADLYLGAYTSVYAGLPGPRNEPKLPWIVGIENRAGAEISVLEGVEEGRFGPNYGRSEIGASAQAILVGGSIGIDPIEIVDFALGILTLDLRDDDL